MLWQHVLAKTRHSFYFCMFLIWLFEICNYKIVIRLSKKNNHYFFPEHVEYFWCLNTMEKNRQTDFFSFLSFAHVTHISAVKRKNCRMQADKTSIWQMFAFQNNKGHWIIKLLFLPLKNNNKTWTSEVMSIHQIIYLAPWFGKNTIHKVLTTKAKDLNSGTV